MIVGIVATNVLGVMDLNDSKALGVLLVGLFFQGPTHVIFYPAELIIPFAGIGTFMTFFYICIYILRFVHIHPSMMSLSLTVLVI